MSRLDNFLVENGLCESRNRAQSIIKDGLVSVNGEQIIKSSLKLKSSDKVVVKEYKEYVSRAALNLALF